MSRQEAPISLKEIKSTHVNISIANFNNNVVCGNTGNSFVQVIKNIRNVTRHRNGQNVKSRQTRWEWQLLISIMHIHDVVTRYNNCAFLCVTMNL